MLQKDIKKIDSPFDDLLQMHVLEQRGGYAKVGVTFRKELTNPWGFFHGGFLATLADTTAAIALVGFNLPHPILTGEIKIRFKSPSSSPEIFSISESHQIKLNLFTSRVKIIDKDNKLIAIALVKSFLPNWKKNKS